MPTRKYCSSGINAWQHYNIYEIAIFFIDNIHRVFYNVAVFAMKPTMPLPALKENANVVD